MDKFTITHDFQSKVAPHQGVCVFCKLPKPNTVMGTVSPCNHAMCNICFRKGKEMLDANGHYFYFSCVGCGSVIERITFADFYFNAKTPASLVHVCLSDQDGDLRGECLEMITKINRITYFTEEVSNRNWEGGNPVGFFLRITMSKSR
jgi:hypothetical protein